jgi:hypothetical protein
MLRLSNEHHIVALTLHVDNTIQNGIYKMSINLKKT